MGRRCKDITEQRFGDLVVLERAEDYISPKKHKIYTRWKCQCLHAGCGNTFITYGQQLTSGRTICCPKCAVDVMAQKKTKRNEYEFTADACIGYTNKGEVFTVDIEDYDKIKDYTWHYDEEGYVKTIVRKGEKKRDILLSRLVMNVTENADVEVDHIHGSQTLGDNRKENLRVCKHQNNACNRKKRKDSKQKYKGVRKRGNRYYADISYQGKRIFLGEFETEEQAKDAYNKKAKELHGEFACLN